MQSPLYETAALAFAAPPKPSLEKGLSSNRTAENPQAADDQTEESAIKARQEEEETLLLTRFGELLGSYSVEQFTERLRTRDVRHQQLARLEEEMRQKIEFEQIRRREIDEAMDVCDVIQHCVSY